MFSSAGLHAGGWGSLADAVESGHSYLVLCVGVEPPNAVAGGGDAVHGLVFAVRPLGSVLNNVVRHWVGITRIPGDGDAGGCGLRDDGSARRFW